MTEHIHDRPQARALSEQQCGDAMVKVVESLLAYSRVHERLLEGVRDIGVIERPADGRGEDKSVILPLRRRPLPFKLLAFPRRGQRGYDDPATDRLDRFVCAATAQTGGNRCSSWRGNHGRNIGEPRRESQGNPQ